MRNFREALGIVKEEKEKALKELALIRKHNTHLVDSLDKSVDSIMLKDKQLKDLRFQLEQTRGALECAKMEAAVRQACSENRVKTLREEIEAQKADIEELRGSNEDLKSVVQKLSKEVRHQQDHIALRYIEPESAENHAMEALRKAIKESQEAKRGKYVSVARERSLNNLDGHSERHRISKERICAIVDVPTGLYHSLKTKLLPEGNCLSNKSISDKPSPAAVSTNSSRILRKGKVVEHTGFAYPKEHTVPDCIPEPVGTLTATAAPNKVLSGDGVVVEKTTAEDLLLRHLLSNRCSSTAGEQQQRWAAAHNTLRGVVNTRSSGSGVKRTTCCTAGQWRVVGAAQMRHHTTLHFIGDAERQIRRVGEEGCSGGWRACHANVVVSVEGSGGDLDASTGITLYVVAGSKAS
ncbi:hypothetical protein JR316_0005323, partial [Psilocybe cubensis]